MAKTTNSGKASSPETNYGGGYGKIHIVHDKPISPVGSMPSPCKTPPPPKSKTGK